MGKSSHFMDMQTLKQIKAKRNYRQTLAYVIPGAGLWIIFLVWILFKSGEGNRHDPKRMGNSINRNIVTDTSSANITSKISALFNNASAESSFLKCKVMTWNLQGLMTNKLHERTKAVVEVIESESPDIIFFQELIPSSYKELSALLKRSYATVSGTESVYSSYFTGIFYRKSMFRLEDHKVTPFSNTVMDRTKLVVKLALRGRRKVQLALLTTHLESLPRFKEERISQLKDCFETCINFPPTYNVIFAGDLNLEENEEEGSIPENMVDLWVEGGSLDSNKYTWDSTKNHNQPVGDDENQKARVRYDRMYFRNASPKTLQFEKFELLGQQLVAETSYFPSDHWAIMSSFAVTL